MNAATRFGLHNALPADAGEDGQSLPAWIYHDAEFFEREKDALFRTSWQIVCHVRDVPRPGDFHSFEFLGESIIVLRGCARRMRSLIPESRLPRAPARGWSRE